MSQKRFLYSPPLHVKSLTSRSHNMHTLIHNRFHLQPHIIHEKINTHLQPQNEVPLSSSHVSFVFPTHLHICTEHSKCAHRTLVILYQHNHHLMGAFVPQLDVVKFSSFSEGRKVLLLPFKLFQLLQPPLSFTLKHIQALAKQRKKERSKHKRLFYCTTVVIMVNYLVKGIQGGK